MWYNHGFVLTSFGIEVDIKTNRLAAQARSRYFRDTKLLSGKNFKVLCDG